MKKTKLFAVSVPAALLMIVLLIVIVSKNGKANMDIKVPDHSFWYFTASPSYLTQMGIEISEEEINTAHNGTRLYLIPDTLSESETEKMQSFLKEDAVKQADAGAIGTAFAMNQEVRIIKYAPKREYFTWPGDRGAVG